MNSSIRDKIISYFRNILGIDITIPYNTNGLYTYNTKEPYIYNTKEAYICFVDFQKAYDTVPHEAMLYKLRTYGTVGKHITTFRNYMLILRYVYVLETHYHPLFLYNEDYVKVVLYLLFSSLSSSMIFSTLSSRQMNGIHLWKALCLLMIFVSSLKQKLIYEN